MRDTSHRVYACPACPVSMSGQHVQTATRPRPAGADRNRATHNALATQPIGERAATHPREHTRRVSQSHEGRGNILEG
eukprot:4072802-Pyramimonas_sp.AAC.1